MLGLFQHLWSVLGLLNVSLWRWRLLQNISHILGLGSFNTNNKFFMSSDFTLPLQSIINPLLLFSCYKTGCRGSPKWARSLSCLIKEHSTRVHLGAACCIRLSIFLQDAAFCRCRASLKMWNKNESLWPQTGKLDSPWTAQQSCHGFLCYTATPTPRRASLRSSLRSNICKVTQSKVNTNTSGLFSLSSA